MTTRAAAVTLDGLRAWIQWVTVALLILSLGLHWAVLQTAAWAGMAVAYSAQVGLRRGLAMTFDGQHPCPLCKTIERGRAEEQEHRDLSLKPGSKLDPVPLWTAESFIFWRPQAPLPPLCIRLPDLADPPPKPPPRPSFA